jgi:hypothetical protein
VVSATGPCGPGKAAAFFRIEIIFGFSFHHIKFVHLIKHIYILKYTGLATPTFFCGVLPWI